MNKIKETEIIGILNILLGIFLLIFVLFPIQEVERYGCGLTYTTTVTLFELLIGEQPFVYPDAGIFSPDFLICLGVVIGLFLVSRGMLKMEKII